MWIVRFHILKTNNYNYISRECKKENFHVRKLAPMLYIKAMVIFMCQGKSWRSIGQELGVSHVYLFHFYKKFGKSQMLSRIFHHLSDNRIILYIGEKRTFTSNELDNSEEYISLTKRRLDIMMPSAE